MPSVIGVISLVAGPMIDGNGYANKDGLVWICSTSTFAPWYVWLPVVGKRFEIQDHFAGAAATRLITTNNTWTDILLGNGSNQDLDLPSAGIYRIYGHAHGGITVSAFGGAPIFAYVSIRAFDTAFGAPVPGTFSCVAAASVANISALGTGSFHVLHRTSQATSVKLQAIRQVSSGTTVSSAFLGGGTPDGAIVMGWERVG